MADIMTERLKILAFEAWAEIAEKAAGATIFAAQERRKVLGVTVYLMAAFVTGNVLSEVWNIYLRSMV